MKKAKKAPASKRRPPIKYKITEKRKIRGRENGISESVLLKPIAAGLKKANDFCLKRIGLPCICPGNSLNAAEGREEREVAASAFENLEREARRLTESVE